MVMKLMSPKKDDLLGFLGFKIETISKQDRLSNVKNGQASKEGHFY